MLSVISRNGQKLSVSSSTTFRFLLSKYSALKNPIKSVTLKHSLSQFISNGSFNNITQINKGNAEEVLSRYDSLLLDCDGVLWNTDYITSLSHIPETVHKLRNSGKQVLFVTNNSRLSRDMLTEKFLEFGIEPGATEDLFCVTYAIGIYLRDVLKITGSVYTIGSKGMERELTQLGLNNFGTGEDPDKPSLHVKDLLAMSFRNDVQAVVVGFDEFFSYTKLYKAASYLSNKSCHFIVPTSRGSGITIGQNRFQPLTGPIVSAVSMATTREPTLIGKPASHLFKCIGATHPNIEKSRCLMIGDSLTADIAFAKACGIDSALVLSGSSSLKSIQDLANENLPNYYMNSLADLRF